jgi:hypothetical protein
MPSKKSKKQVTKARGTSSSKSARKAVAKLVAAAEAKGKAAATRGPAVTATGRRRPATALTTASAEATQAQTSTGQPTKPTGRRRWTDYTLEQLKELYEEKVGRPSSSDHVGYLRWKIREAEMGRIHVGPVRRKVLIEGPKTAVSIVFGNSFLAELDAARKEDGYASRLAYFRDLIGRGLQVRGHAELAGKVTG